MTDDQTMTDTTKPTGDTDDDIVLALADYYDEWTVSSESFKDADPHPLTRYILRFERTQRDPEKIDPDELDVQEVFTESCGTVFDWTDGIASEWKPNDPCIPTIETIIRAASSLTERPNRTVARGDREQIAKWLAYRTASFMSIGWDKMFQIEQDHFLAQADDLLDSLESTTPAETTDPAMERDDAE